MENSFGKFPLAVESHCDSGSVSWVDHSNMRATPLNRIAVELLANIFSECALQSDIDWMSPLVLSHVSHHWRVSIRALCIMISIPGIQIRAVFVSRKSYMDSLAPGRCSPSSRQNMAGAPSLIFSRFGKKCRGNSWWT